MNFGLAIAHEEKKNLRSYKTFLNLSLIIILMLK